MSRVPKHVQATLALNSAIERAEAYAQQMKKGGYIATWHTKDMQRLARSQAAALSDQVSQLLTPGSAAAARDAGMKTGVETVKLARQARLRELFAQEALAYEAELNAMGLALVKPRD
mmetsp:Transcript_7372/g.18307  ORF Transcript_7372/g.18307 Transcript_7372/m.18307 type:complete len:117 (-) Transcript_7372:494-844(-)